MADVTLVARLVVVCSCKHRFERNTPIAEIEKHMTTHTHARVDKLMMLTMSLEPGRTADELRSDFGDIIDHMYLDPPINGLYYASMPLWKEWQPWSGRQW